MDAASRRPQLPALSYLDIDKVKREEESYQNRNTGATHTLPAVTAASPTYPYPSGPPPPYSQPPSHIASTWSGAQSGAHTPPESRRTSAEESESIKQTTMRQSLPSLSEALGVDSQTPYSSSTTTLPSVSAPTHPQSPPSAKRSFGMEPPTTSHTNGYHNFRPDPPSQPSFSPQDPAMPSYTSQADRPPLHLQTSHPPARQQPTSYPPYVPASSPGYEQSSTSSSNSMGPPSFAYGYAPYPSRYTQPTSSSASAGPIYQPSATFAAPLTPTAKWKSESAPSSFGSDERLAAPADYSTSVKRHLDLYDLEGSLNEIAQSSSIMMDFSRRYGDRLHQTARSGHTLQTLPGIVEVDDMIHKSRVQLESLMKIRDVVITQQAAYEQQAADQRQQHKSFAEPVPPGNDQDADEAKGGFAGADAKKRRGRAAPPGRCHSCNRAETPEWRRGPDGARTLCNACGLHYAKLTRKQQGANKGTSVGSSNLRPKEA